MIGPIRISLRAVVISLFWAFLAPTAEASVSSELAFHRGVVAFSDARYDAARTEFEKVVTEDPEDTAAWQYLGLIEQEEGEYARAVENYDRALAIDPSDVEVQLDRASALLELGNIDAAKAALEEVLKTSPDDPRANLFAGIAAYRSGEYDEAMVRLDRAKSLDPALETHATYYAGLSAAFLGNFSQADGAFAEVEEQSPMSPLSLSAKNLREQMRPATAAGDERPWVLAISAGMEWDSNPTFAGKSNPTRPPGTPDFGNEKDDYLGVFRVRASYDVIDSDPYTLTAGYDGYLSAHKTTDKMDLQTHVAWLAGSVDFDPIRVGLRYDYAFSFLDMTNTFRSLNRITPSITYRESDWGVGQVFAQWQNERFLVNVPSAFDRDANRYDFGINQYFFLPEPVSYLRLGGIGIVARADSPDFSYDGLEVSGGGAIMLPFEVELTALYRFLYRDFRSINAFPLTWGTPLQRARHDYIHRVSIELVRSITEHIDVSVASALSFQDSNIDAYDHNRSVVGAYVSYNF